MAIFQVVEQDGQKTLVEVPVGSDDIWGRYVPGVVPDNPAALIADLPVGAFVVDDMSATDAGSPAPNTEVWITESGTWTVPVTGWYEVTVIGGGAGAYTAQGREAISGSSGEIYTKLLHLTAEDIATVTIGAPGENSVLTTNATNTNAAVLGGKTIFQVGDVIAQAAGGGVDLMAAGGYVDSAFCLRLNTNSVFFPGEIQPFAAQNYATMCMFGIGSGGSIAKGVSGLPAIAGAIHIRYYDPTKSEGI